MSTKPATPPPGAPKTSRTLDHRIDGGGARLVLAHGFTQTSRVWASIDADLARDHQVVAVDMPGHGGSSEVASTLVDGALLLAEVGGRAHYLGYSMGARFCLHLALARPDLVDSLVLISGTAGIEDEAERLARRRTDAGLADRLDPDRRSGDTVPVEAFLREWMANPIFGGITLEAGGLEERKANTGGGLASSLRLAGTGSQLPLWNLLHRLEMPVLVVTGGSDEKFSALGRRIVGAIGSNATLVEIPGTGHAPHLQRPDVVAGSVRRLVASGPGR
jgi:2-succinyl-6-hydroxy-2,4-cyclohexadiene-1-carboxylate synthase